MKDIIPHANADFAFHPKDLIFLVICTLVISLLSLNNAVDFKDAFEQKFYIQKQKDDFEEILNSFPEAVLIV